MSFFVYILQNLEGRLYIGQTLNLELRLRRHNEVRVFLTKNLGPWSLECSEEYETRPKAMAKEKRLKALKNKQALMEYVAQAIKPLSRPE